VEEYFQKRHFFAALVGISARKISLGGAKNAQKCLKTIFARLQFIINLGGQNAIARTEYRGLEQDSR